MFNIGITELLVILSLALIFIGPKQLPEVARTIGRLLNELRRASDEALQTFRESQSKSTDFIRKTEEDLQKGLEPLHEGSMTIRKVEHESKESQDFEKESRPEGEAKREKT